MMNKVSSLDKIFDEKIHDGMTIMMGGFLGIGVPLRCIDKLVERKVKDITLIAVVNSYPGGGFDYAPLFKNQQVKKFITAHNGTCPEALAEYKAGNVEVEYFPMGTWVEKIRAGGSGLGGVLTPIGLGTLVEEGKEKVNIQGKDYLLELPLRADVAFVKAFRADSLGNLQYRGVSLNSNPILAPAADFTVAEVNEIVDVGGIDPERVGTPGVFVKAVVQGYELDQQQKIISDLWKRTGRLA